MKSLSADTARHNARRFVEIVGSARRRPRAQVELEHRPVIDAPASEFMPLWDGPDNPMSEPAHVRRVVVTPLHNFAMPILRYEIGGLAEVGPDDQCVFRRPTLSRILGRTRNLFKLCDGSRVWPDTRTSEMHRYVGLSQVQIVQTGIEEMEVRYVPDGSSRPADEAGLQEYFRSVIHPSLSVRAVAVNETARTPSGKLEDYVSLAN